MLKKIKKGKKNKLLTINGELKTESSSSSEEVSEDENY